MIRRLIDKFFELTERISDFGAVLEWPFYLLRRVGGRLFEFGAWLISPFEWIISWFTSSILRTTDQLDRFEALVWMLIRGLTWPFRLVKRLLPDWLLRMVAAPFVWVAWLMSAAGYWLMRMAGWLNLDVIVYWLIWLTQPIWRPFAAIGGFFIAWVNTRYWRGMLWGVPAAVLLVPVLALTAKTMIAGQGGLIEPYKQAVKEAIEAKDYERAQLYEQKLAQLGEDTQLANYRTALSFAEEGRLEEAYERMKQLAPEEVAGYAQAHYWIAYQLMNGKLVDDRKEASRLAKVHLDHLETLGIHGSQLQFLQALWLLQGDQLQAAADALEPLVPVLPNAAFERMRLDLRLDRVAQARQDARAVSTHMSNLNRRNSQLGASNYKRWLTAEELQGNLGQMKVILQQWLGQEPESEEAKPLLAVVLRKQAEQELRSPLPDAELIVKLLIDAAELDEDPQALFKTARQLYIHRDGARIYQRLLEELRDASRTPAQLLSMIGTEAAVSHRYEEAREFLAKSVARDESNVVAWNNYAIVLSEGEQPDLEKALDAVNRALEISPEEFRFRETRGQILVKMKQWEKAIVDLEYALNGMPELKTIHESLAVAYEALGNEELAVLHRNEVEQ